MEPSSGRRFLACIIIRFALWLNAAADRLISIAERLLPRPPEFSIWKVEAGVSLALRRQGVLDPFRKSQRRASA